MNELKRIRELDNEVFEELKEYFPKTVDSNFRKDFPTTAILITMIDSSATFIKNSIFNCCEKDDYYGSKILYRSLIEHFIRFKYLFINWAKNKTDEFSKIYLEYNDAKEILDSLKAKVAEEQLFNPDFKISDWDKIIKSFPNFKNKTLKEIDEETAKYSFKNIVRFLNTEFKKKDNEMSEFLGKLIIDYSRLSSFVHGGMGSYKEIMSSNTDTIRENEYNRICGLTFQMSNSIKLFSLLMYIQTDKHDFTSHYLRLEQILKQIDKANTNT
jgi:hypothetical protein